MRQIAIIGAGPSGCYAAEQLLRAARDVEVSVVERLPVPFGLVRYGVSPDHQGTKAISRLFERALGQDRACLFGHVVVGSDVTLAELGEHYDAIVLAAGATRDRKLGVPGEALAGVHGSGAFVSWYNSHPDYPAAAFDAVRSAVVIGNGNVALDVARMLARTPAEFEGSDLSPEVSTRFAQQPLQVIHVVGRRGPAEASFTPEELAELRHLQRAAPRLAAPATLAGLDSADNPNLEIFNNFAESVGQSPVEIQFHFHLRATAFVGNARLQAVEFVDGSGEPQRLPAELAVSCIGYEVEPCDGLQLQGGVFANEQGRVGDSLYVVGWAGRGPSGTIPTSRREAKALAQRIAVEVTDHARDGAAGLAQRLASRGVKVVDCAGWRCIDAAEQARAGAGRCREKFASAESMLALL